MMKTNPPSIFKRIATRKLATFSALIGALMISGLELARADIPDASSTAFGGIYKVTSSTDPAFPITRTREYFLDFGSGIQANKPGGNVAVSVRENPRVSVRVMAWQYFPQEGRIVLGNRFAEGSRNAVIRGNWRMRGIANGVIFERGNYQVILQRAGPNDY